LLSPDAWEKVPEDENPDDDQGEPSFSQAIRVRNSRGETAYLKPGIERPGGSHEAAREVIASNLARLLSLPVPMAQLYTHPEFGPCCVSMVPGTGAIMRPGGFGYFKELAGRADAALQTYVPILVLDVLMGVTDRSNRRNHLYVANQNAWYSIDYGNSFNRPLHIFGVGDPNLPYEAVYWDNFMTATALNATEIRAKLKEAAGISGETIEGLIGLIPESFAALEQRKEMVRFLNERVLLIDAHTRAWLKARGLGTVL
jgi:hypothetical protein